MKRTFYPLFLLLFFSFTSCGLLDDIEEASKFDVPLEATVTVPQISLLTDTLELDSIVIETALATVTTIAGTDTSKIEKLSLKALKISISSPSDANFDFLNSAKIYIKADNYPEIALATISDVPANATSPLSFNVDSSDFKKYLLADKFILRVSYLADKTTSEPYKIKISPVFFVDLKILNQ